MSKRPIFVLTALFLLALSAGTLSAATLVVGKPGTACPSPQYATIGAAIQAAASGDGIEICPAVYAEQLIITKPLSLRGIDVNGFNRILLQPTLSNVQGLATEAVITVLNTNGVTIQNLAIDASHNTVSSCSPGVAGVHFSNSSGVLQNNAIFGAHLANPLACTTLPFGNGFGVQVDASQAGSFTVWINGNSIHDFTANGIQVNGACAACAKAPAITAEIADNSISGVGPTTGVFQFGVFILNGATARIIHNVITEGLCGTLAISDCISQRSEGVTLRAIGDGTVVDGNIITNAQSGIFINGANLLTVTNNQIRNIDAMSGMDIQASASGVFTNSVVANNSIFNVGPIDQNASTNEEGCGINEYSGTGTYSGNQIWQNTVSDAYCGVAHVGADQVLFGTYFNTLYPQLDSDLYPNGFPPATEP
jgi:Right handed beta helix region